jgi:hypothetical protein
LPGDYHDNPKTLKKPEWRPFFDTVSKLL